MQLQAVYQKYILHFKFDASTSRGVMKERNTYFIKVWNKDNPAIFGLGEASPLAGLSLDDRPDFEEKLNHICNSVSGIEYIPEKDWLLNLADEFIPDNLPSIKFAFETAFLDLSRGGERIIFDNEFSKGKKMIPINGLVWMGDKDFMLRQIEEKLEKGFSCIKIKIGAIDFEQECALLQFIRKRFAVDKISLRVDANGAFRNNEVLEKLNRLAEFELHSIEQPIKAGQEESMAKLCKITPFPIALDEELIGKNTFREKENLLETIKPQFIVLKPTLLGGFKATEEWIEIAEKQGIAWWITSALESNIGLNAIAQFTANYPVLLPQGLGTGALYHNNINSPLKPDGQFLSYYPDKNWHLGNLNF